MSAFGGVTPASASQQLSSSLFVDTVAPFNME